jgi:hypothetical protein
MNTRRILITFALTLILNSVAGVALAQQTEGRQPPPPMHPMMGLSGICGDQEYLYLMAGGKIMQYEITDLKLLKTVDLPKPAPPPSAPPNGTEPGQFPPHPPMAGPHGLWAGESSLGDSCLYVLAGPVIHRYSTPDLTWQITVELPKPELPEVGK